MPLPPVGMGFLSSAVGRLQDIRPRVVDKVAQTAAFGFSATISMIEHLSEWRLRHGAFGGDDAGGFLGTVRTGAIFPCLCSHEATLPGQARVSIGQGRSVVKK